MHTGAYGLGFAKCANQVGNNLTDTNTPNFKSTVLLKTGTSESFFQNNVILAYFKILSQHILEGTEEKHDKRLPGMPLSGKRVEPVTSRE